MPKIRNQKQRPSEVGNMLTGGQIAALLINHNMVYILIKNLSVYLETACTIHKKLQLWNLRPNKLQGVILGPFIHVVILA